MDFSRLYLSSAGMINRKTWWLGNIGIVLIMFFAILFFGLFLSIIGLGDVQIVINLMGLLITLGALYLCYNISVKRLRDRDRPLSLALVFVVPSVVAQVLQILGITGSMQLQSFMGQQIEVFTPNLLGTIIGWISIAIGIWALIELGILPGRQAASSTPSDYSHPIE